MPRRPITGLAPSCRSITDPYSKTARELKACGYEVYPLVAIDTGSDGARVYVYDVNGSRVQEVVPPAGLTYATATPEQRDFYGLDPGRPLGQPVPPTPFLIGVPWIHFGPAR